MNKYLKAIRQRIAQLCESESPFSDQVEVDESYFGVVGPKANEDGVLEVNHCLWSL